MVKRKNILLVCLPLLVWGCARFNLVSVYNCDDAISFNGVFFKGSRLCQPYFFYKNGAFRKTVMAENCETDSLLRNVSFINSDNFGGTGVYRIFDKKKIYVKYRGNDHGPPIIELWGDIVNKDTIIFYKSVTRIEFLNYSTDTTKYLYFFRPMKVKPDSVNFYRVQYIDTLK